MMFCPGRRRPERIEAVTRLMSFDEATGVSSTDSPLIAILRREPSGMTTTAFLYPIDRVVPLAASSCVRWKVQDRASVSPSKRSVSKGRIGRSMRAGLRAARAFVAAGARTGGGVLPTAPAGGAVLRGPMLKGAGVPASGAGCGSAGRGAGAAAGGEPG